MGLALIAVVAAALGLLYGHLSDGFIFSTKICLFAGLTLIMPSLFKFKLSDIALLKTHYKVVLKSLLLNYLALPLVALGIGYVTGDFGIAMGLLLVALLAGGGMVVFWIKQSGGNTSLGFLLLFINLLLIPVALLELHYYANLMAPYFDTSYDDALNIMRFTKPVLILLIVIPFVTGRILSFFPAITAFFDRYRKLISQASIFIIIFYLFGLQSSQELIELVDFEPWLILVGFVATLVFYLIILFVATLAYNNSAKEEIATFWHTLTRYITLALVISTFTTGSFGASMLLPVMFAYLVQIPMAAIVNEKLFGASK